MVRSMIAALLLLRRLRQCSNGMLSALASGYATTSYCGLRALICAATSVTRATIASRSSGAKRVPNFCRKRSGCHLVCKAFQSA